MAKRFALLGKSGAGKSATAAQISTLFSAQVLSTGVLCRTISRLLFGNDEKASTQLLDDALTQLDPSIFVRAVTRDVSAIDNFVIDALRFKSDLELATELGCVLVRIVASDEVRLERLSARGQSFDPNTVGLHRSELELDNIPVDLIVNNDGTRDELNSSLAHLLQSYS